jgi:hypothetical protein
MLGTEDAIVNEAGVPTDDESDWVIVRDFPAFIAAVGKHRKLRLRYRPATRLS